MVPDRRAIGEIRNGKRRIQYEKHLRRSLLIEATVDDHNSLMNFRKKRLDVGRLRFGRDNNTEIFK